MKAEIINGVLIIYPQTETEGFAVSCWLDKSTIKMMSMDPKTLETEQIKGSSIKMNTSLMGRTP